MIRKATIRVCVAAVVVCLTAGAQANDYYADASVGASGNGTNLATAFKTIGEAASLMQAGDTCHIRGGTYYETVTPANSGTAGNPVTFTAYNGEEVTLSAADPVTDWTLDSGSIYYASVSWDMGAGRNLVFVGNEMMIEARWPNISGEAEIMDVITGGKTFPATTYSDRAESASLTQSADFWKGGVYWGRHGDAWSAQSASITGSGAGVLYLGDKTTQWWWCLGGADFLGDLAGAGAGFITGVRGALDQEREFFLDAAAGRLYLWAPGGQNPNGLNVCAKRRVSVLVLSGKSYIRVDGLNGVSGGIDMDDSTCCIVKNGVYKGVSHFWNFKDGRGDNFLDTGFDDPAAAGVYLSGASNRLENLTLAFSSGPGVRLDGRNQTVTNCTIQDVGYSGTYAGGIYVDYHDSQTGQRGAHVITGNTISRVGRAAVHWNSSGNTSYLGNLVTHNEISDFLMMSSDGGALYGWNVDFGADVPTVWAYNWIHDARGLRWCSGMYPDNNGKHVSMHHNVVWNTGEGVRINQVSSNIEVYNNTFWNISDKTLAQWLSNYVKVYNNLSNNGNWEADGNTDLQNNLTSSAPGFVGAGGGGLDYRLQSSSPAVDGGRVIAGITDGYVGVAPDIGAYECGSPGWGVGAAVVPLTVGAGAGGTASPNGAVLVAKGAATTIVATPAVGYEFMNWTLLSGSATFDNAQATNTTVAISAPTTVQANFIAARPVCAITQPADGAVMKAGTNLTLGATASISGGAITNVAFYRDGVTIGEDPDEPYSCVWTNVPIGYHVLTAKAMGNEGGQGVSASIHIIATSSGLPESVVATGGTVTNYSEGGTNFTAHIFRDAGTNNLQVAFGGSVEALVVGGGGGGAAGAGSGGGAGGFIYSLSFAVVSGSNYAVTVGAGGAVNGGNGSNSIFDTLTAYGGGGGVSAAYPSARNGNSGGSGGGGSWAETGYPAGIGGACTNGQGHIGGNGTSGGSIYNCGGGGGAGSPGANASSGASGDGGTGLLCSISGVITGYAGGGGGGADNYRSRSAGSAVVGYGGGNGGYAAVGADGVNGTGGGGGGGGNAPDRFGGGGGSGIVIVRYVTGGALSAYEQWRRVHFTSEQLENIGGDNADPDGDGMNNLNEFYAGTIPTNGLSVLCLTDTSFHTSSSEFVIRWQSVSGRWYTVQATTNLVDGFDPIPGASNIQATCPVNVYTADTANVGMRFYRIRVQE